MVALTANAIRDIYAGAEVALPVLQVSNLRKVTARTEARADAPDRYRLLLSDGAHAMQAILGTQLNALAANDELPTNCIVSLRKYICNAVQPGRKIIIVLDLQILDTQSPKIGNPQGIENTAAVQQQQQQQGAAAPAHEPAPAPVASRPAPALHQQQQQQATNVASARAGTDATGFGGDYWRAPAAMTSTNAPFAAATSSAAGFTASALTAANNVLRSGNTAPRGMSMSEDDFVNVFPIISLNPYQNRWTIKARVTSKSELRSYHNAKGEGKLFSFDMLDASGEIRVTAFNDVATRTAEMIEKGKVYYISRGSLKQARRPFNLLKHDYEIQLENNSLVKLCEDNADNIPSIRYDFVTIDQIEQTEKDAAVDVLAVVRTIEELGSITAKATQKTVPRRNISLVDQSGRMVQLTLWNQIAETFDHTGNPVVAVKSVRVSDFNGRSLSTINTSLVQVDPDLPAARELRTWYAQIGNAMTFKSISDGGAGRAGGAGGMDVYKTLLQAKNENLGTNSKPDFYANRCYITQFRVENISYMACPTEGCNKKVIEEGPSSYFCDKCAKRSQQCDYRYILNVTLSDMSGSTYATIFNELGEQVIGKKAGEMETLRREDMATYQLVFANASFREYHVKIRAKQESYNGEDRLKQQVMRATPVDYVTESREIIRMVRAHLRM